MGNMLVDLRIGVADDDDDDIVCGKDALGHFDFDNSYRNLNHGSFGTYPSTIKDVLRNYQDDCEARPDEFIRYTFPKRLDESREAIARYVNAPVEACVFVPNATTGINTVLRNLVYQPDDIIIYFSTIYGSCEKTIKYLEETTPVRSQKIELTYPISDDDICSRFEDAVKNVRSEGRNPRLAMFDTIVSLPGVRMPFERLTELCRKYQLFSCIDGAHSVGQIPLNLEELDPDFFVSNCHKWLLVPRGAAVFYVPVRNQRLMRSTLPTSHGFIPEDGDGIFNPLPPSTKSEFVQQFEYVGTLDSTPYLCVPAALQWRSRITYDGKKGEAAIFQYLTWLAMEAGRTVAEILGTDVMENKEQSLGSCSFSNVRLPLSYKMLAQGNFATAFKIAVWISETLHGYGTFMALLIHDDAWWVRLSSMIYLTVEDFEWAGTVLSELCNRVKQGEWKRKAGEGTVVLDE